MLKREVILKAKNRGKQEVFIRQIDEKPHAESSVKAKPRWHKLYATKQNQETQKHNNILAYCHNEHFPFLQNFNINPKVMIFSIIYT